MSDFILPDDLRRMAEGMAHNIADAWAMLEMACVMRQIPLVVAEAEVQRYVNTTSLSQIEAIHKVYLEVVKS